MPARAVDLADASTRLTELVEEATRNGEVVLTLSGEVVARIIPVPQRRRFGSVHGLIVSMAEDFDAPLEDFRDYM
jgi:prevent-host-death family protein